MRRVWDLGRSCCREYRNYGHSTFALREFGLKPTAPSQALDNLGLG
jgi:hypothetical protein